MSLLRESIIGSGVGQEVAKGPFSGSLKAIVIIMTDFYCLVCACYFVKWSI